jgi:hypothetical protein
VDPSPPKRKCPRNRASFISVVFNPNADYEINADLNESGGIVGIEILALGAEELGALRARLGSDVVPALCELAK